jgi:hypothetical protein
MKGNMRLTEAPLDFYPQACAVTNRADGPIIDTGATISGLDPRVYLRTDIVEKMAVDLLEMVPKAEVDKVRKQVEDLKAKVDEYAKLVDAYQRREQADADLEAALS